VPPKSSVLLITFYHL